MAWGLRASTCALVGIGKRRQDGNVMVVVEEYGADVALMRHGRNFGSRLPELLEGPLGPLLCALTQSGSLSSRAFPPLSSQARGGE